MQVSSIVLYGTNGERRTVDFRLGAVNVITGQSGTGKSTLIDILDYCLGRSTFNVFEGRESDAVAWYGVVLRVGEGDVFIAKPPPRARARSQSRAHLSTGTNFTLPEADELKVNSNDAAVRLYLDRALGMPEGTTVVREGRDMEPFQPNLSHAKHYLFLNQNTVANRTLLFWRQDEEYIPQHIKDTLPYFLGAIDEERVQLERDLRQARKELRRAERRLRDAERLAGDIEAEPQRLLAEAAEVGLFDGDPVEVTDADAALRALGPVPSASAGPDEDRIDALQRSARARREDIREVGREIRQTEAFLARGEGFKSEAEEQARRLDAVKVFGSRDADAETCPICASTLDAPTPDVEAMTASLQRLRQSLDGVARERPRVQAQLAALRDRRDALRDEVRQTETQIRALLDEADASRALASDRERAIRVAARVEYYLEKNAEVEDDADLQRAVETAAHLVDDLKGQLDPDAVEDALASILSVLSVRMTRLAENLELGNAGAPHRLDVKNLSVVADTEDRAIPMHRMGSAHNWLGCHVIAFLALHEHFARRNRPVPGFLVLDQPSQVYFPSKAEYEALDGATVVGDTNGDLAAVQRLFDVLFDAVDRLTPQLQIIVLEHANLDDERYQNALVEPPWTGGRALIPTHWIDQV
ncbi:MAG: DUF3732 domain-containing protein [Bacteroidota bacterium]